MCALFARDRDGAGEPERRLEFLGRLEGGRPRGLSNVAFSPSGKILASSDEALDDGPPVVKLWDVDERKAIATLRGLAGQPRRQEAPSLAG